MLKRKKLNILKTYNINLKDSNVVDDFFPDNIEYKLFEQNENKTANFGNEIKKIDPNTFNGLDNLEWINFSSNQIKEIDPNTFNGLDNLKWIKFSHNEIKKIDPNTFNGLYISH